MRTLTMDSAAAHGWHWADNKMYIAHDLGRELLYGMRHLAMDNAVANDLVHWAGSQSSELVHGMAGSHQ